MTLLWQAFVEKAQSWSFQKYPTASRLPFSKRSRGEMEKSFLYGSLTEMLPPSIFIFNMVGGKLLRLCLCQRSHWSPLAYMTSRLKPTAVLNALAASGTFAERTSEKWLKPQPHVWESHCSESDFCSKASRGWVKALWPRVVAPGRNTIPVKLLLFALCSSGHPTVDRKSVV